MIRRVALFFAIAIALLITSALSLDAAGQESPDSCASSRWLEPESTGDEAAAPPASDSDPLWMNAELTDACSGQVFSLTDLSGKVIYVEAMATWCPPCRDQLDRVRDAMAQLPPDVQAETVFVALSSEVDLPREALAQYAADNDFPFVFAVMPAGVLQSMVDSLGQEVAVAPATPHVIVGQDGSIGELHTGSASAEDILVLLDAARAAPAS